MWLDPVYHGQVFVSCIRGKNLNKPCEGNQEAGPIGEGISMGEVSLRRLVKETVIVITTKVIACKEKITGPKEVNETNIREQFSNKLM